jgi:hypothetical protein
MNPVLGAIEYPRHVGSVQVGKGASCGYLEILEGFNWLRLCRANTNSKADTRALDLRSSCHSSRIDIPGRRKISRSQIKLLLLGTGGKRLPGQ